MKLIVIPQGTVKHTCTYVRVLAPFLPKQLCEAYDSVSSAQELITQKQWMVKTHARRVITESKPSTAARGRCPTTRTRPWRVAGGAALGVDAAALRMPWTTLWCAINPRTDWSDSSTLCTQPIAATLRFRLFHPITLLLTLYFVARAQPPFLFIDSARFLRSPLRRASKEA